MILAVARERASHTNFFPVERLSRLQYMYIRTKKTEEAGTKPCHAKRSECGESKGRTHLLESITTLFQAGLRYATAQDKYTFIESAASLLACLTAVSTKGWMRMRIRIRSTGQPSVVTSLE